MNKYNIKISHDAPDWDELTYEKSGSNKSYLTIYVSIEVYLDNVLIHSNDLEIEGVYCCCGSINFDIDNINQTTHLDCDDSETIMEIYNQLKNNNYDAFYSTVLDSKKYYIFEELLGL